MERILRREGETSLGEGAKRKSRGQGGRGGGQGGRKFLRGSLRGEVILIGGESLNRKVRHIRSESNHSFGEALLYLKSPHEGNNK